MTPRNKSMPEVIGRLIIRTSSNLAHSEIILDNIDVEGALVLLNTWTEFLKKSFISRVKRFFRSNTETFCIYDKSKGFNAIKYSDIVNIQFNAYEEKGGEDNNDND
jgi:hypothetical protein